MRPDIQRTSYDEVPYVSHPFRQTHPDRLATVGSLFGMQPPPIDRCRVLEVGCAAGENLLPMACRLPQSEFVGVDLSEVQIAAAQSFAKDVDARNLRFVQMDLCELPSDLGEFDYIIAHGVYSWISISAQESLLNVCRTRLAPQGIGYVSYNTYPGWHMRGMVRDMMNYRVRALASPTERIQQSRELLQFLANSVQAENSAYSILLNSELSLLSRQNDSYLFHEHLEEHNSPLYFHQFADRAASAGLQYLGDADFSMMFIERLPDQVEATLRRVATTLIEAEQYMDFVRNRMFRQTLLCRDSVALDRSLPFARILPLFIASQTRAESSPTEMATDGEMKFRSGDSIASTSDPLTKAALLCLGESWPRRLSFPDLLDTARRRLAGEGQRHSVEPDDTQTLAQALLGCYANGHIELSMQPSSCETKVNEKPVTSHLARRQSAKASFVTNEFHTSVQLHDHERYLLRMLDGDHDLLQLTNGLVQLVLGGTLPLPPNVESVSNADQLRRFVERAVAESLKRFANYGLLVG